MNLVFVGTLNAAFVVRLNMYWCSEYSLRLAFGNWHACAAYARSAQPCPLLTLAEPVPLCTHVFVLFVLSCGTPKSLQQVMSHAVVWNPMATGTSVQWPEVPKMLNACGCHRHRQVQPSSMAAAAVLCLICIIARPLTFHKLLLPIWLPVTQKVLHEPTSRRHCCASSGSS